MEVQQVLSMNGGDGEASYANNSLLQKKVILEVKPMLEESITELYCNTFPECLRIADLGCSSGPNTLLPLWEIIDCITAKCSELNREPPVFQMFLNDLPQNGFNTVFKSLAGFYEKMEKKKEGMSGQCFIAGVPGSFHRRRLFPDRSIHFFHSSYSLHWLSQVPEGLVSESGTPLNKGNIHLTATTPPRVLKAYLNQFETDFTAFLISRSREIIPGGRMLLTLLGQGGNSHNSSTNHLSNVWELISMTLKDMVIEGLVQESEIDSLNIPLYMPSAEEARRVIQKESSFTLLHLETYKLDWDANIDDGNKDLVFDKYGRAKYVVMRIRAVGEPIFVSHFGGAMLDSLFHKIFLKVVDNIEMGEGIYTNMVISLSRNESIPTMD